MESTRNVELTCAEVVRDFLDATLANESPSSFQSSCPGGRMLTSSKNVDENSNCTSKKSKSSGGVSTTTTNEVPSFPSTIFQMEKAKNQ